MLSFSQPDQSIPGNLAPPIQFNSASELFGGRTEDVDGWVQV